MQLRKRVLAGFMATIMALTVLLASPQMLVAAGSRTANWIGVGAHQFDVSYSLYGSWSFSVAHNIYRLDSTATDLFLGVVPLVAQDRSYATFAYATSTNLVDWTIIAQSTSGWLDRVVYEGGSFLYVNNNGDLVRVNLNGDVEIASELFSGFPRVVFYNGAAAYVASYWDAESETAVILTSQDGNTWEEVDALPYSQDEICDETNGAILHPQFGFETAVGDDGQPVANRVSWEWDGYTNIATRERLNFYVNGERLAQPATEAVEAPAATEEPEAPPSETPPPIYPPLPPAPEPPVFTPVPPAPIYPPIPPAPEPPVYTPAPPVYTPAPPVAVYTPAPAPQVETTTLYVTASFLNQRRGAGNNHAIMGVLSRGEAVTVIGSHGGWRQVSTRHGEGWVFSRYLTDARPAVVTAPAADEFFAFPAMVSVAHALNLRTGPGNNYNVIAWLRNDDWATVIAQRGPWSQVETASGTGWVLSRYLVTFEGKW